MDRETLWNKLVKENPEFTVDGYNFSAKGLRKFFDIVYTQAHDEGSIYSSEPVDSNSEGAFDFASLLSKFGRKS